MAFPLLALPLIAKVGAAAQVGKSAVNGAFAVAKLIFKIARKGTKLLTSGIRRVTQISRKSLKKIGTRVKANMAFSPGLWGITCKKPSFTARFIGGVNAGWVADKVSSQSFIVGATMGIHNRYYTIPSPQVQQSQEPSSVSHILAPVQLERVRIFNRDISKSIESLAREETHMLEIPKVQSPKEKIYETSTEDNKQEAKISRRNSSKRSKRQQG